MFAFTTARKNRNNLFGARLVWQPGTAEFILENVAEGSQQAALSLRLRPRAAVGSSWVASTSPALTATLTSRSWDRVGSQPGSPFDSVAVVTLSSGAVVRLSRQYGLLAGPRWLTLTSTAPQYVIRELPVALAGSPLSPDRLFDLHPGDLLGYETTPQSVGGPPCTSTYTLRAMLTRQVVGDSLIFTYRQQSKVVNHRISGCFGTPPGTVLGPVQTGRLAFSLRTGQSQQYEALPLLSGEYRELSRFAGSVVLVGLGLSQPTFPTCQSGNTILGYEYLHRSGMASNNTLSYGTITDGNWFQHFAAETGLGDIRTDEKTLQYSVKSGFTGPIICGSNTNYATLLPTRAAQAAAIATLHPNPAAEAATLTLVQPARAGASLRLTDALGRAVWRAPVAAGQRRPYPYRWSGSPPASTCSTLPAPMALPRRGS